MVAQDSFSEWLPISLFQMRQPRRPRCRPRRPPCKRPWPISTRLTRGERRRREREYASSHRSPRDWCHQASGWTEREEATAPQGWTRAAARARGPTRWPANSRGVAQAGGRASGGIPSPWRGSWPRGPRDVRSSGEALRRRLGWQVLAKPSPGTSGSASQRRKAAEATTARARTGLLHGQRTVALEHAVRRMPRRQPAARGLARERERGRP